MWFGIDPRIDDELMLNRFREVTPSVHRIPIVLPGYRVDDTRYRIAPSDPHPNALAHDLIAEYIVHNILVTSP